MILNIDCIEGMRAFPDNHFDSVVTDPPYELGFMGKSWDASGIAYNVAMWREALRVLKPGGHMLAFSGSRTYHRMVCAIEDAGFEVRDQIMWVYSSGFPKSHNLDNHRGKLICGCTIPYDQTESQCDVRFMHDPDVSAPIDIGAQRGQILQPSLSEQSPHRSMQRPDAVERCQGVTQCGVEGRRDASDEEGQLRAGEISSLPARIASDGSQGRVHHGASIGDGEMVRQAADANGMRASCGSRSDEQRAVESGIMAGQSQPQVSGAWPLCGGCGKPMVPAGWGTALKPAHEPICVARKPLAEGTVAANVLEWGTGAVNIDGCRVGVSGGTAKGSVPTGAGNGIYGAGLHGNCEIVALDAGRWPANLIHDGSGEVLAAFPQAGGQQGATGKRSTGAVYGEASEGEVGIEPRGDTWSAARFFYCAKASKSDRDEGLDDFKAGTTSDGRAVPADNAYQRGATLRANIHPTVKPTDLMRYLCRLITPPDGTVLDPFAGSGSTGKAAVLEGFSFVGFELSAEYAGIAQARIDEARLSK